MARKLLSLKVSPWSERAKWALDHHALDYQVVEHLPVLGERRLRRIVGPGKARATVPVLVVDEGALTESWDIAVYADRVGTGSKLIPAEHEPAIARWTALADEAMQSGRALVMAAMLASPTALDEAAPFALPSWVRPLVRPITRRATLAFVRKYDLRLEETERHTRAMRGALDALREALAPGTTHLLGTFTYADIVLATMMQGISPVADAFLPLGAGTREAWTHRALAGVYADLLGWRDKLYERHRAVRRQS